MTRDTHDTDGGRGNGAGDGEPPSVESWRERIARAQTEITYMIDGVPYPRIRYGDESQDWSARRIPCHDCAVVYGQLHVPGCDVEECPSCHRQALTCGCGLGPEDDDLDDPGLDGYPESDLDVEDDIP